jgi:hypothetical protein
MYKDYEIIQNYEDNLEEAKTKLKSLSWYNGQEIKATGLNGWVFEETIQYCLKEEFLKLGKLYKIETQIKLGNRAVVDLGINNPANDLKVLIEIKLSGLFSPNGLAKYIKNKIIANKQGVEYLYITGYETCKPYKLNTQTEFGNDNSFFLNDGSSLEWERFVNRIINIIK